MKKFFFKNLNKNKKYFDADPVKLKDQISQQLSNYFGSGELKNKEIDLKNLLQYSTDSSL